MNNSLDDNGRKNVFRARSKAVEGWKIPAAFHYFSHKLNIFFNNLFNEFFFRNRVNNFVNKLLRMIDFHVTILCSFYQDFEFYIFCTSNNCASCCSFKWRELNIRWKFFCWKRQRILKYPWVYFFGKKWKQWFEI